jgi:hypothetical protein
MSASGTFKPHFVAVIDAAFDDLKSPHIAPANDLLGSFSAFTPAAVSRLGGDKLYDIQLNQLSEVASGMILKPRLDAQFAVFAYGPGHH